MPQDAGVRALGGALVGIAAAMFAQHAGMENWQIIAVAVLVGFGIPMATSGRWKGW